MALPLAAIPLIASGLQTGIGAIQGISGAKKRRATVRPTYAIPDEIRKNLNMAEQEATYGLDAASKQIAQQGIDRSTAAALYGGSSRRAGLAGLSGITQSANDAWNQMAAMDAQAMAEKKARVMAARSEMAGYKDKEFAINKMEPYQMSVDESQALIGAGLQNVMGGLNTAAMTGMYGVGGGETKMDAVSPESATETTTEVVPGYNNMMDQQKWYMSLTPEQKLALTRAGKLKLR